MKAPVLMNPHGAIGRPGAMKRPGAPKVSEVRKRPGMPRARGLWLRRVGWLVLIWVASVAALAAVALVFRAVMSLAGMTA